MKKCEQCQKEFEDEINFCPNCGEKLQPVILDEPPEEVEVEVIFEDEVKKQPRWLGIVCPILSFIILTVLLLSFLSGTTINYSGLPASVSGIEWYFGAGIQYVTSLASMPYKEFMVMEIVKLVLQYLTFICGLVGVVVFTVFAIIHNVKAISNNEDVNFKYLILAVACSLPHYFTTTIMSEFVTSSSTVLLNNDSGAIIFCLIATSILVAVYQIIVKVRKREKIVLTIFSSIAMFIAALLIVVGKLNVVGYGLFSLHGAFYLPGLLLYNFSNDVAPLGVSFLVAVIGAIFMSAAYVLSILLAYFFVKKDYKKSVIFASVSLGVHILSYLMISLSYILEEELFHIGFSSYAFVVLSIWVIVISAVLLRNGKAEAKE